MIRKITLSFLATAMLIGVLKAQKFKDFEFEKAPFELLTDSMKSDDENILYKNYSLELLVPDNQAEMYELIYTVRYVNSSKAIERRNRIYVYYSENKDVIFQKARVTKLNGEVIDLKESDIKEGLDEESESKYYYYAIEGLEVGSIIEFASYKKVSPKLNGSIYYTQGSEKIYNQDFELICPQFLIYKFKGLNGLEAPIYDTLTTDANRWYLKLAFTDRIEKQKYLYVDPLRKGLLFKLDKNTSNNSSDITSYGSITENVYNILHPTPSKAAAKKLNKIYKELELSEKMGEEEKIRAIENYCKQNFQIVDNNNNALAEFDFMLENKATNHRGISVLHVYLLNKAGIKYEIVLTTDRSDLRFDPDFEAYLFLDKYLLYFPGIDKYLAPTERFTALGFVPELWMHNYGLFVKAVDIGGMQASIGKVKFIEALPASETKDIMEVDVDFSESISQPKIKYKRTSTGYYAHYWQPYFHLLEGERRENLKKTMAENISEQLEAEDIKTMNIEAGDFGAKPFIVEFSSIKHPFIEMAGSNILFKVGELIGPQTEMYQENERVYGVETSHTRFYERNISFTIPEGYEIRNLDDIKINYVFGNPDKPDMVFTSDYTKDGNTISIKCIEYYDKIIFPVEEFEDYKKVINAAADFNKVVYLMKKI